MQYYSLNKIMSYNALINIIIGSRSIGKTYACKEYVLRKYAKEKKKFIYLRRFVDEIDKTKDKFFSDINKEVICKGNTFYLNNDIIGECYSFSDITKLKSASFDEYNTILFDEFIIEDGIHHYFKNEVKTLISLISTVNRLRIEDKIRVLLLGNAFSGYNPYFLYWNITNVSNGITKIGKEIVIEMCDGASLDIKEKIDNNPVNDILADTEKHYIVNNMFSNDNMNLIKSDFNGKYLLSLNVENVKIGCYYNNKMQFYFSEKWQKCNKEYSLDIQNLSEEIPLLNSDFYIKKIKQVYSQGGVCFENLKVKKLLEKYLF